MTNARDRWLFLICIAGLLAIPALKLTLLRIYGTISAPDTVGYESFAELMLAGNAWLGDAELTRAAEPTSVFRMAGYPALLALAHRVGREHWRVLVAGAQIALSLLALAGLITLRRPLRLSAGAMVLALLAIATSSSLVLDATLLSDSVHATVVTIAVTLLARAALAERPLGTSAVLGVGMLLALAFLLREAMLLLWVALLPLLACAARVSPLRRGSLWRSLALVIAVLLPLAATSAAYSVWNWQRTGVPFVATNAQTSLLIPVVAAAARAPGIFAGDTALDRAAHLSLAHYDFRDVLAIEEHLFADAHMTAPEIAAAATRKYLASWRDHPEAMLHVVESELRPNQVFLLFRPVDSLREYMQWGTGASSELGRWTAVPADPRLLPLFLAGLAEKAISSVLFLAFVLLPPWRLWRKGWGSSAARAAMALWLLYFGWLGAYLFVRLETRDMAPVLPFAVLVGIAELTRLRRNSRMIDANGIS